MKLINRHVGANFYSEYVANAGETLGQIAKDLLHDANLANTILRWNNNKQEMISAGQNVTGWTLLIPEVPASFLARFPAANKKLAEIKARADSGALSAEDYYAQRKLILSVL